MADEIKAHSAVESFTGLLLKGVGAANKAKKIDNER
jgi:hypothetical protein